MEHLFPAINGFYQLEHDAAIEKANQAEDEFILEYVMVVLTLMTIKKFNDFFQKSLRPEHQKALDSNIFEDDPERLQKYIQLVREEVMDALEEDYFGTGLAEQPEPSPRALQKQATVSDKIFEQFYATHTKENSSIGKLTRSTHGGNCFGEPRRDDRRCGHVGVAV